MIDLPLILYGLLVALLLLIWRHLSRMCRMLCRFVGTTRLRQTFEGIRRS